MTQPARISDAWISDAIEKAPDEIQGEIRHTLDWLEPPPTYISSGVMGESTEGTTIEQATGKLPSVRFVARLRPPLLIPAEIAAHSGINQDFTFHNFNSYITPLLLHKGPLDALNSISQMPPREVLASKTTIASSDGIPVQHANTLEMRTYDTAILLHDIPFEHPKQLIQLLPVRRIFYASSSQAKQCSTDATAIRVPQHSSARILSGGCTILHIRATSPLETIT
jgi:hypothetical protein